MNNSFTLVGALFMAVAERSSSFEMMIIGRFLLGLHCGELRESLIESNCFLLLSCRASNSHQYSTLLNAQQGMQTSVNVSQTKLNKMYNLDIYPK